jgi:hypothetical protein
MAPAVTSAALTEMLIKDMGSGGGAGVNGLSAAAVPINNSHIRFFDRPVTATPRSASPAPAVPSRLTPSTRRSLMPPGAHRHFKRPVDARQPVR